MDSFEATEMDGFVHMMEPGADRTFCGLYIVASIPPDGDTDCCPTCIKELSKLTGIDIEGKAGGRSQHG